MSHMRSESSLSDPAKIPLPVRNNHQHRLWRPEHARCWLAACQHPTQCLTHDRCVQTKTVLSGELFNCAFLVSHLVLLVRAVSFFSSLIYSIWLLIIICVVIKVFPILFVYLFILFIFCFKTLLCVSVVKLSHTPSTMVNQKMVFNPSKAWSLRPAQQTALRTERTEQPAGAGISPPPLSTRKQNKQGTRWPRAWVCAGCRRWEGEKVQWWIIL